MEVKEVKRAIQAILFASGDPISVDKIANALDIDKQTVSKVLANLMDEFEEGMGLCIIKLNDEYQMCTKPCYSDYIRKIMDLRRHVPLSPAAMEVLAIVAYNQPVTKAFIEQIRGVDCSGSIASLCTKNLIEEKGRLELPGRPLLYGTTLNFLKCFGISSLDELPSLDAKDDENK